MYWSVLRSRPHSFAEETLLQCCCSVVTVCCSMKNMHTRQLYSEGFYLVELTCVHVFHAATHCNNTAPTLQQRFSNTEQHCNNTVTQCRAEVSEFLSFFPSCVSVSPSPSPTAWRTTIFFFELCSACTTAHCNNTTTTLQQHCNNTAIHCLTYCRADVREFAPFTSPHGMADDNNLSCAADIVTFSIAAMKFPLFAKVVRTVKYKCEVNFFFTTIPIEWVHNNFNLSGAADLWQYPLKLPHPRIHQVQKFQFFGTNSNQIKISIWICTGSTNKAEFLDLVDF